MVCKNCGYTNDENARTDMNHNPICSHCNLPVSWVVPCIEVEESGVCVEKIDHAMDEMKHEYHVGNGFAMEKIEFRVRKAHDIVAPIKNEESIDIKDDGSIGDQANMSKQSMISNHFISKEEIINEQVLNNISLNQIATYYKQRLMKHIRRYRVRYLK